ncbi:MAG: glycoside hydrolase family 32 protein [Bacteroidetes bacterium]|nr:glycoside hydrolase family 32 protein [Bacteroidota bacterium]
MKKKVFAAAFIALCMNVFGQSITKEFRIEKQYLNIPVDMQQERQKVHFLLGQDTLTYSVIRIADKEPDYWVFKDVSAYKGKKLILTFTEQVAGIGKIYQSDEIAGADSLYNEKLRPQIHYTTQRGWNNDPNGLVYHDGEYHLFYQHNPYETNWENMHWGHAVSKDLLHWEELPVALFPDEFGTMFSGSAVIDKNNTAGWGKNTMVAFYTAAGKKMTQNVAYSTDRGRTFRKYEGNPILGPDRDPKVFWYEPTKTWVMVLYNDNFFAIYNSKALKKWEYKSQVKGFFECPEFFELPVDGNENNKKWVMYGASGTYMIGKFNGETFIPEHGKYYYSWGSQYAAQTYNNEPNGRRIQIGWGRVEQPGMPFNQMMLFPCELTLRSTPEGVRMFCNPVDEINKLHKKTYSWKNITGEELNDKLKAISSDLLHVKMDVEILHGLGLEIHYRGNPVIYYDGNFNRFNGAPYICETPGRFRFSIEMLIDKTSVEGYVDSGKLFISEGLKKAKSGDGLRLMGDLKIHSLELNELESIY